MAGTPQVCHKTMLGRPTSRFTNLCGKVTPMLVANKAYQHIEHKTPLWKCVRAKSPHTHNASRSGIYAPGMVIQGISRGCAPTVVFRTTRQRCWKRRVPWATKLPPPPKRPSCMTACRQYRFGGLAKHKQHVRGQANLLTKGDCVGRSTTCVTSMAERDSPIVGSSG